MGIPDYLYSTAYGERYANFGVEKNQGDGVIGNGVRMKSAEERQKHQQAFRVHDYDEEGGGDDEDSDIAVDDDDEEEDEGDDGDNDNDNEGGDHNANDDDNDEELEDINDSNTGDDGDDRNRRPVADRERNFDLPQIFPSRSAAELDSTTGPKGNGMVRNGVLNNDKAKHAPPSRKEQGVPNLPGSWILPADRGLSINDGTVDFNDKKATGSSSVGKRDLCVRSNYPIPAICGVYYYEIKVERVSNEEVMAIGLGQATMSPNKLPGLELNTYGYHSDDGRINCNSDAPKKFGPRYGAGDIIGCGINFHRKCIFYTKNGLMINTAFGKLSKTQLAHLHPCVGLRNGQAVRANFGVGCEPFLFDIKRYVREEKAAIFEQVDHTTNVPKALQEFQAEDLQGDFIQELIAAYFSHIGFLETAKAFEQERGQQDQKMDVDTADEEESKMQTDVFNRQKIRELILVGDVDGALKRLQSCYPSVLENDDLVLFKLKCRKFVEMVRKSKEREEGNSKDVEMGKGDGVGDDDVLGYGRELHSEYKEDGRPEVKQQMDKIFSLLAYDQPMQTPELAQLFDRDSLVVLAEELNSAILVSQGKPPTASLQKLAQHTTEVMWELVDHNDTAASLINVRNDYM